jgi:hypothetical protein
MQLVILAAGLARRFGAAKQFAAVAPDGASLLEVTARDAARAGCTGLVLVTAPGGEQPAGDLFAARPAPGLDLAIAIQRPDDLPAAPPPAAAGRTRPWGTAHAVWSARHAVDGPFLLFNADDHYGPNAPADLMAALAAATAAPAAAAAPAFAMLGYPLDATLSPAGAVSRAVCETDTGGWLTGLREYPAVDGDGRVADGPDAGKRLSARAPVSMNAWAFTPAVFPILEDALRRFLAEADLAGDECYLPAAIDAAVREGRARVLVAPARDRWCGLTWPEDRPRVVAHLRELDAAGRAAAAFGLDGPGASAPAPFGGGLIHATWRVDTPAGSRLLQRLNAEVFADPVAVAANAAAASARVDDALAGAGDHDPRHRLTYLPAPGGAPAWRDEDGAVWRAMVAIDHARPADPGNLAELRAAAAALGRFPGLVAAGRGPDLAVTLPGFHDTTARLAAFRAAVGADRAGRLAADRAGGGELADLCRRLESHAALALRLPADLPVRPVHNDAKPDNVLVDAGTGEALCVIDLDTVMPGLAVHDFGDLVRAAVTGRPEDEPDLDAVAVRRDAFDAIAAGYLDGARQWLTGAERAHLLDGALVITWEQALRFAADHLDGDVYYRVDDADHNRRRAAAQLRLLELLLRDEADLRAAITTGA